MQHFYIVDLCYASFLAKELITQLMFIYTPELLGI